MHILDKGWVLNNGYLIIQLVAKQWSIVIAFSPCHRALLNLNVKQEASLIIEVGMQGALSAYMVFVYRLHRAKNVLLTSPNDMGSK